MSDILRVIFDKRDCHPDIHEGGEAIDCRIDRLAGGSARVRRGGPDPRVPIKGLAAKLELHETGPIFLLDPSNLPTASSRPIPCLSGHRSGLPGLGGW